MRPTRSTLHDLPGCVRQAAESLARRIAPIDKALQAGTLDHILGFVQARGADHVAALLNASAPTTAERPVITHRAGKDAFVWYILASNGGTIAQMGSDVRLAYLALVDASTSRIPRCGRAWCGPWRSRLARKRPPPS